MMWRSVTFRVRSLSNQLPVFMRIPDCKQIQKSQFVSRAALTELMDEPSSYEDFRACLMDIDKVNQMTFGHIPIFCWLRNFRNHPGPLHIVDVGCGSGKVLRAVEVWARRVGLRATFTGVDINEYAVQTAGELTPKDSSIRWVPGDVFDIPLDDPIDIVISSLLTHHLSNADVMRFIAWMETSTRLGWCINDLHRRRIIYYASTLLVRCRSIHPFVRHDGPVSVLRSFSVSDWNGYLTEVGIDQSDVSIRSYPYGRLCVARIKA